jgi:DNA-binding NtrC family response regulator
MSQGSTRARVLHWFVRGGTARTPDGKAVTVDVDPVVIGRDEGAHIRLEDPEVSAIHCELRAVNEGVLVRDLGSTNGTFAPSGLRIRECVITTPTEITVGASKIAIEPTGKQKVDVGFADRFGDLVGQSPKMRRVFGVLEKVAKTPLSILILGETGTGKEVVAKSVHNAGDRKDGPFVVVDCGSIPATLAESILFGHEKGAFTGATERKKGALAEAHGGTLFLDELGELPLDLQPKLLRVLAERHVKRVGGNTVEPIDVRVLAATRRDLGAEMNAGRFRSDLFFRIAQVRVELPALRERLDDLPLLVEEVCKRVGNAGASGVVLDWIERRLGSYDWPGNVRELVNVAQVAATLADTPDAIDDVLTLARDAMAGGGGGGGDPGGKNGPQTAFAEAKRASIASFEKDYFASLAKASKGNVSEMARQSGMERHHVRAYLRKYGIETAQRAPGKS